jgi:arsenate reductase
MVRQKVLFVCIHNSARSQMAEAFLNHLGADRFEAESAGLEPGTLNPLVVAVMREEGIEISGNRTKGVEEFLRQGRRYDVVVTVCDEASAERCPVFPGSGTRLHWGFPDPGALLPRHGPSAIRSGRGSKHSCEPAEAEGIHQRGRRGKRREAVPVIVVPSACACVPPIASVHSRESNCADASQRPDRPDSEGINATRPPGGGLVCVGRCRETT